MNTKETTLTDSHIELPTPLPPPTADIKAELETERIKAEILARERKKQLRKEIAAEVLPPPPPTDPDAERERIKAEILERERKKQLRKELAVEVLPGPIPASQNRTPYPPVVLADLPTECRRVYPDRTYGEPGSTAVLAYDFMVFMRYMYAYDGDSWWSFCEDRGGWEEVEVAQVVHDWHVFRAGFCAAMALKRNEPDFKVVLQHAKAIPYRVGLRKNNPYVSWVRLQLVPSEDMRPVGDILSTEIVDGYIEDFPAEGEHRRRVEMGLSGAIKLVFGHDISRGNVIQTSLTSARLAGWAGLGWSPCRGRYYGPPREGDHIPRPQQE